MEMADGNAEVVLLAVDPASRRQGAGRSLLMEAQRWARERGHAHLIVDWRTTNTEANRFWLRVGTWPTAYRWNRTIDPTEGG
jgi:GNAT superfamily N-acetyltransferase